MEEVNIIVHLRPYTINSDLLTIPDDTLDTVLSPKLHIPPGSTQVPILWSGGAKDNVVAFVDQAQLLRADDVDEPAAGDIVSISAHGVALRDASPKHATGYLRGDRFWLMADTSETFGTGERTINVLNLRTCETGYVVTRDVCWYPTHRDGGGELYTFSGACKEFSSGRAACVRLRLGVAQSTVASRAVIVKEEDIIPIPPAVSEQRYHQIFPILDANAGRDDAASWPGQDDPDDDVPAAQSRKRSRRLNAPVTPHVDLRKATRDYLYDVRDALRKRQVFPGGRRAFHAGAVPAPTCALPAIDRLSFDEAEMVKIIIDVQVNRERARVAQAKAKARPGAQYAAPTWTAVVAHHPLRLMAALRFERSLLCTVDLESLRRYMERPDETIEHARKATANLTRHVKERAEVCAANIPHCPFSTLLPNIFNRSVTHHHPDPEKCYVRHADHCVTREEWPGPAGGCLLKSFATRFPNHRCCVWTQSALRDVGYVDVPVKLPDGVGPMAKVESLQKAGVPLVDLTSLTLSPTHENGMPRSHAEIMARSLAAKDALLLYNADSWMDTLQLDRADNPRALPVTKDGKVVDPHGHAWHAARGQLHQESAGAREAALAQARANDAANAEMAALRSVDTRDDEQVYLPDDEQVHLPDDCDKPPSPVDQPQPKAQTPYTDDFLDDPDLMGDDFGDQPTAEELLRSRQSAAKYFLGDQPLDVLHEHAASIPCSPAPSVGVTGEAADAALLGLDDRNLSSWESAEYASSDVDSVPAAPQPGPVLTALDRVFHASRSPTPAVPQITVRQSTPLEAILEQLEPETPAVVAPPQPRIVRAPPRVVPDGDETDDDELCMDLDDIMGSGLDEAMNWALENE